MRHAKLTGPNVRHGPALRAYVVRCVVDGAVAIVIDAVAPFRAGLDFSNAIEDAADALLRSLFARKDVARSARHACVTGVVVGLAVTIVILAIASFGYLSRDLDVWPDARVIVTDARVHTGIGDQPADATPQRFVTPTNRTNLVVAREIIGAVDETVAIVIEAITALLDTAVRRGALVFATRRVGFVEIDPAGITRSNFALRVGRCAGLSGRRGRGAGRRSVEHDAVVAANATIGRARTQVDVFIDSAIAIVVLVVALRVVIGVLDAVVRTLAVAVEVIPTGCAARAGACSRVAGNLVPVAADARRIRVRQLRVTVVVTRAAVLRAIEVDAIVGLAVAVVVEFVADLNAAVRDHARAGTRTGTGTLTTEDATTFATKTNVAAGPTGPARGGAG